MEGQTQDSTQAPQPTPEAIPPTILEAPSSSEILKTDERSRTEANHVVVCRECGWRGTMLYRHLRKRHKMTVDAYSKKWDHAPLVSEEERGRRLGYMEGYYPRYYKKNRRRITKAARDARAANPELFRVRAKQRLDRNRPGYNLYQRDQRRERFRKTCKVSGTPALDWEILCLAVQGYSGTAIAKEVGRPSPTVAEHRRALGFSGWAAFYDLGEPWTLAKALQLKTAAGLSVAELAKIVGLPHFQHSRHTLPPAWARKLVEWRDEVVRKILIPNSHRLTHLERRDRSGVLKTFFPKLRGGYNLLHAALSRMQAYLEAFPEAGANELQGHLCAQDVFRQFLPWAPELMPFIEANLDRLRGSRDIRGLALEALAKCCNTTPEVVEGALRGRTHTIAPLQMRHLILSLSQQQPAAAAGDVAKVAFPGKHAGGRPPEKKTMFQQAKGLREQQSLRWTQIAKQLDPNGFADNPRAAAERMRLGVKYLGRSSKPDDA